MGRIAVFALACACLAGCSGDGKAHVQGQVKLDGQPVADGTIDFLPAAGDGPTASAVIKQGAYEVALMPGSKIVKIEGFQKIGEHKYDKNNPESPMVADFKPIVPAKYNTNTELKCEITEETKQQDFELTSQ